MRPREVLKAVGCAIAVVAGVALILVVAFVGCTVWYYTVGGPNAGGLQRQLDHDLPTGTSLQEIYSYLDTKGAEKGIDYEPRTYTAKDSSVVTETGFSGDTPYLGAIQRDDGSGLTIDFVLDKDLRLQRIIVQRYDTLP